MEDTEQNKPKQISELERAKAWITTLILAIAVCLGLIIYSLITYNPALNFLDSSLFKPGLVWLGFTGMGLFFISFLLFRIATSVFRFLSDKKPLDNITAILGLFCLSISFKLLFSSYDLENHWMHYLGLTIEMTGASGLFLKELVEHKFPKTAKIWNSIATIILFTGMMLLTYSSEV